MAREDACGSDGVLLRGERHGEGVQHQPEEGLVFEHDDDISAGQTLCAVERLVGGQAGAQEGSYDARHSGVTCGLESELDQGESAGRLGKQPFDHVRRVLLDGIGAGMLSRDSFQPDRIGSQALEHAPGCFDRQIRPCREVVGGRAARQPGLIVNAAVGQSARPAAPQALNGRVQQQGPTGRIRRHGL